MAITDTDTQNTVVCGSEASNKNVVSKAEGNQTPETVRALAILLLILNLNQPSCLGLIKEAVKQ